MTTDPGQPDRDTRRALPPGLAAELRALYRAPVAPRAGLDEAVLNLAGERAALARGKALPGIRPVKWIAGAATAAVVAIGVFIAVRDAHTSRSVTAALAGDVNGDGRVDILDALVLARDMRAVAAAPQEGPGATAHRPPSGLKYDLNHDGTIDDRDIDLIAVQAVRLTTPETKS